MKVLTLTREYPPHVYGGAGVHVGHLMRELAKIMDVEVRTFGDQNESVVSGKPGVTGYTPAETRVANPSVRPVIETIAVCNEMAAAGADADVVHCHTWYSMLGGLWIKKLYGLPLVVTTHSLEPLRPWKADQLGRGYAVSSWIEKTAVEAADCVIAVSEGTRREVLDCYSQDPDKVRVIYNGIDLDEYQPRDSAAVLNKYRISREKPYLLFVGRITRQKGVLHLVRALERVTEDVQAVLCAGAPDTPEIAAEMEAAVKDLQRRRSGIYWIREAVPVPDLARLYSGAVLFVCPSIYEPFGIINLEAMATGCPVVASKVGGIPEVVVDGETGLLVSLESRGLPDFQPVDPAAFARDLANAIERLFRDPDARERMGAAGLKRVKEMFSWKMIAAQTRDLYGELLAAGRE